MWRTGATDNDKQWRGGKEGCGLEVTEQKLRENPHSTGKNRKTVSKEPTLRHYKTFRINVTCFIFHGNGSFWVLPILTWFVWFFFHGGLMLSLQKSETPIAWWCIQKYSHSTPCFLARLIKLFRSSTLNEVLKPFKPNFQGFPFKVEIDLWIWILREIF